MSLPAATRRSEGLRRARYLLFLARFGEFGEPFVILSGAKELNVK